MLTVILTGLLTGASIRVPVMLFQQLFFGLIFGVLFGKGAVWALNRLQFQIAEGKTIFVFAAAVLAYAVPVLLGGNGYLSVYLCGIIMGNSSMPHKRNMVQFFDALTGIAQMMIFFLLGLLVTPSRLGVVLLPSAVIMVFLTLVGRPLAVTALLGGFKASWGQIGIVS